MTATRKEREEFLAMLVKEFPALGEGFVLHLGRLLMRSAATVNRYAEMACNVEMTKREEKLAEQAEARCVKYAAQLGCTANLSGDPRGYCVKLMLPSGRYNTCGGKEEGWGVPA